MFEGLGNKRPLAVHSFEDCGALVDGSLLAFEKDGSFAQTDVSVREPLLCTRPEANAERRTLNVVRAFCRSVFVVPPQSLLQGGDGQVLLAPVSFSRKRPSSSRCEVSACTFLSRRLSRRRPRRPLRRMWTAAECAGKLFLQEPREGALRFKDGVG